MKLANIAAVLVCGVLALPQCTTPSEFLDPDGDGYGADSSDCEPLDVDIHPGAADIDNLLDDDCDRRVDEDVPPPEVEDQDADGASPPADCDDEDATVFPSANEQVEMGVDNDCDGVVDEGTGWEDRDGDGVPASQDCDDLDLRTCPGCGESPNGLDDDCDELVDEDTSAADDDGDGVSERGGDCDDANPSRYPNSAEWPDGLDQDCDGGVDEGTSAYSDDEDLYTEDQGDCNDSRSDIYPGSGELEDGWDQDCDGLVDEGTAAYDDDGDGLSENEGDRRVDCGDRTVCDDDQNASIYPGAPDPYDGVDNDCDCITDEDTDQDSDGWNVEEGDCNDASSSIHPAASEIKGDDTDSDCDHYLDR